MTKSETRIPAVHRISGLFIFLLLALLAVFSLIAVMLGIQVYNSAAATADSTGNVRTSLSYVVSKVRAGDASGMVALREIDGLDIIVLSDTRGDGILFHTYIYFLDGALMEYYSSAEYDFNPQYGSAIVELQDFDAELSDGMFYFSMTDADGNRHAMHLYLYTYTPAATEPLFQPEEDAA